MGSAPTCSTASSSGRAAFTRCPSAEKTALGVDRGNGNGFTGYLASGGYSVRTSKVNDNTRPDLNAAFFMDRERPADDPDVLAGKLFREPNKWPTGLPGFRDFLLRYWDALEAFSRRLLPAFAAALDLPPDYFDRAFEDAQCVLRLSHSRPSRLTPRTSSAWRRTPTPISLRCCRRPMSRACIFARAGCGWIKAPRVTGSLIINSGDMCRRWTNDRFLSTEHLAVNLSGQDRYSTPFFYTPHIDHPIACLRRLPPTPPTRRSIRR